MSRDDGSSFESWEEEEERDSSANLAEEEKDIKPENFHKSPTNSKSNDEGKTNNSHSANTIRAGTIKRKDSELSKVIDLMTPKHDALDGETPKPNHGPSKKVDEQKIDDYRKLLSTFTTLFGSQHERTNDIKHILATRLFQNSQFEESSQLFEDLKIAYSEDFGEKSAEAISVTEKYILSQIMSGNVDRIAEEIENFCQLQEQEIDEQATDPWQLRQPFVDYLMKHDYYSEAQQILEDCLKDKELSTEVEETLQILVQVKMKLGKCYKKLKKFQKSLDLYGEILSITRHGEFLLNEDELLAMKEDIADLYCKVDDFENALGTYFELYSNYIERHGGECAETLSIRTSIAEALLRQEKVEDALKIYRAVFDSYLNLPETTDELKVHMKHIIGHVYLKENRLFEALQTFRDVLHEYEDLHPDDSQHADILEARSSVAAALLKEKKFYESRMLYKQVWESYKNIHGEEDTKTTQIENILIDLEKLDEMLTLEDREKISKNVEENEGNHFGSQDFDKYILPKLTIETPKNKDDEENNETFLVSNMEGDESQRNVESENDDVIDDLLSDQESNLSALKKGSRKTSENKQGDDNDILQNQELPENNTGKPNPSTSFFDPWKSQDTENTQASEFQNSQSLNNDKDAKTNPVSWDDISLDRNEDADETTDIMQDIEQQNEAKRGSKKKKKKGACCTVS
ncbi:uncharacterized protein [Clytia hemisphaerica]|uniref:Uncharacterized protein n=1 Tax=Clytia hemisphaerica TaxID=252671 RepID=A0A7M5WSF2_9CNID